MKNVLIFGGDGQLGWSLKKVVGNTESLFQYHFLGSKEGDVLDVASLDLLFQKYKPAYIVNCAAYTAVDKAEEDIDAAFDINAQGAENLGILCKDNNSCLIHISTDFVFDGIKTSPLKEEDNTNPIGVYGLSKLKGEEAIRRSDCEYFILRTSWLYSEFGNNFLKTMLRLAETKKSLSVVADQVGTPTYAGDLAQFIVYLISNNKSGRDTYHYSNEGVASWYDFAREIFAVAKLDVKLEPIPTENFPTLAKRPAYSVLSKEKLRTDFNYNIPNWKDSLKECLENIKSCPIKT
ncbi:dTDP-4-dehydrorhamnose reductase [Aequorivita sublithincola DSM 14238]|uniref:dTDP-4-dehydrorhamnose reductase n=1 Tax=Aequorivita sublithincola (strain DSM 14238 / LMG 21431 / ACAM 643 / 9-3) TaxID=746697 RepID=I3YZF4_AEQSU|nr:dTDP-4-dehydrorhamnose reductase [Aequorivita sublithincola DSM 14238]